MNKSTIATVVLLLVIIGAVGFIIWWLTRDTTMPPAVKNTPEERIDQNSGVLMTKTIGQWEKLGQKDGKYKNPDTGDYTMVIPFVCTMCGEKIQPADLPLEYTQPLPDPETRLRVAAEVAKIRGAYVCPKCGDRAYAREGVTGLQQAMENYQRQQSQKKEAE